MIKNPQKSTQFHPQQVPSDSFFYGYNIAMIALSVTYFVTRNVIAQRRTYLEKKAEKAEEGKEENRRSKRESGGSKKYRKEKNMDRNAYDNQMFGELGE